ncbi:MAG: GNAT family N-acetyltransferase [Salibacteraceae bacterium]
MNVEVFNSFPILKTNRLELLRLDNPVYEHFLEITSFNGRARNRHEVDKLLHSIHDNFDNQQGITWGIYLEKVLIGTVGYYRGFKNNSGEIGYVIREKYRGKRFAIEAISCVIDFGFKQLELDCITAYTTDYNIASIGVLESFGFMRTNVFADLYRKYELIRKE